MTDGDIIGRLNQVANPVPGGGLYLEVGTATVAQAYEAFVRKICADAIDEIHRLRSAIEQLRAIAGPVSLESGLAFSDIKKDIRNVK